ncbi:MAG: MFS transporter [Clostridiaceae bacterium]|nr:MFS transporter [Clostridiaceae bacterium]
MAIVEKKFQGLYTSFFSLFIFIGMSMTVIGAVLPQVLADFGWSYLVAGIVIAASSIGYFLATFFAGYLIKSIGIAKTTFSGVLMLVIGLMLFASTSAVLPNILFNFMIGVGQGIIELAVNYGTTRMDTLGTGRAMNFMHGAFSVGAVVGPIIVGILNRAQMSWIIIYRIIGAMFIVFAIMTLKLPFNLLQEEDEEDDTKKTSLVRHTAYWLGFFSLLLYVGVELGISNWMAEYFFSIFGASSSYASFMVSLFWGGILVGRIGIPVFYKGDNNGALLTLSGLLMTISVIGLTVVGYLSGGQSLRIVASIFVALAGLGSAVIYPTVVTFVSSAFPNDQSVAIGFAATGGGIGSFVFPFIMSSVSASHGIVAGYGVYAIFSIFCFVSCVLLIRAATKKEI